MVVASPGRVRQEIVSTENYLQSHVTAMTRPTVPSTDPQLRAQLLDFYLESYSSEDLSGWLEGLGQDKRGSIQAKCERIRAHTPYLGMDTANFPQQTLNHLHPLMSEDLADLCAALGLETDGSKDARLRRVMREVRFREAWIDRPAPGGEEAPSIASVLPLIAWYPIGKRGRYEKDFYPAFAEEMGDVFGHDRVHCQLPIAFGSTLKIDFHIGHPQREGIGIEFKMPTSNADLQRGLGQLDQYQSRYRDRLILVLFPDFIEKAQEMLFVDQLTDRGVTVVVK